MMLGQSNQKKSERSKPKWKKKQPKRPLAEPIKKKQKTISCPGRGLLHLKVALGQGTHLPDPKQLCAHSLP